MFCGFCRPGTPPAPAIGNPCRGGFHIRPGCWRHRKPGRYGIGPYGGAGGSAAMRRRLWRGGGCGTMQASSPTRVCNAARLRFPGWLRAPSGLQGLAPRQAGRYGIGPYGGAGGVAAMRRRLWRGGRAATKRWSLWRGGKGCGKNGIFVSRTKNIRPQAEAAGVYFTGYWARCQVFCRPAVRAI